MTVVHSTNLDTRVPATEPYPGQFTFTFKPFFQYGSCSTAQNGGYINVGKFNAQIDTTKPLSLVVAQDDNGLNPYTFYYFLIEIQEQ